MLQGVSLKLNKILVHLLLVHRCIIQMTQPWESVLRIDQETLTRMNGDSKLVDKADFWLENYEQRFEYENKCST